MWGLLWHSKNWMEGVTEHLLYNNLFPCMFHTRREARVYAEKRYGYIKERSDLRTEPHGWRFPRPVRIKTVLLKEVT